ncbi:MAG: B12-binding domain-containing radical SAM protein [Methanosarcinales archaeon]
MDIAWFCEARVNTINKNILEKMKNAGCTYIQVGVESGSPRILKKIKKNINIEQVKQVAQWSKEVGLRIRASFMFGLPEETYEDAMKTVQLIHELKKMDIDYGANATIIYPGTEVESFAREKGYLPPNFSWSEPYSDKVYKNQKVPLLIQPQMGYLELKRLIGYEIKKDEIFSLNGLFKKMKSIRSAENLKEYWKSVMEISKILLGGRAQG